MIFVERLGYKFADFPHFQTFSIFKQQNVLDTGFLFSYKYRRTRPEHMAYLY